MKKGLTIFLIVFCVLILIVVIGTLNFNRQFKAFLQELDTQYEQIETLDLSTIEDGKYHAKFGNLPVMFDLEVIVKDHNISQIIVVDKSTGPDHEAYDTIERILNKQQCKVDVVTGATISSKTIMVTSYLALCGKTDK